MMLERRIFGGPGVGKSSYLTEIVKKLYEEGRKEELLIVSFTRAAAVEIKNKVLKMLNQNYISETGGEFDDTETQNIGTLHAVAWKSLGKPKIAESMLKSWNDANPNITMSHVKASSDDLDEMPTSNDSPGAALLAELNLLRCKMTPVALYPERIRQFNDLWRDWKRMNGCIDFTDMIAMAFRDVATAPGDPRIMIADEAQDFNPLELALSRKWAQNMDYNILAGDDDQMIFGFTGACPDAFLNPVLPPEQIQVLPRSYRLPEKVLNFSRNWIERIKVRQPKNIRGTKLLGEVIVAPSHFHINNPDAIIQSVKEYVDKDKTVMLLASCSYMLDDLRKALRQSGIPFHNPYRKKRGDWNPIRTTGSVRKILAFLAYSRKYMGDKQRPWTTQDIALWASAMRVKDGIVKRGASKILDHWSEMSEPLQISAADALMEIFEENDAINLITSEPDLTWWFNQLLPEKARGAEYPMQIIQQYGVKPLIEKPKVIIGTIHSVKGGECQTTIVFPDLSRNAFAEWYGNREQQDNVRRVFYVAATRCLETLVLAAPASSMSIRWTI